MSDEFDVLSQFTELAILSKLSRVGKYEFIKNDFFKDRSIIERAADKGYSVAGNLKGAYVGKDYYGLGPITSFFLSRLLTTHLDLGPSTPIPVGFSHVHAPKNRGAVARQFPAHIPENMVPEQADRVVIHAFLWTKRPDLDAHSDVPFHEIPATAYVDVVSHVRVGRSTVESIDFKKFPEQFYVRISGDDEELEIVRDICKEEGYACTTYNGCCITANVDLIGFPPLPKFLYQVVLDKGPTGYAKKQANKKLPPPRACEHAPHVALQH